MNAEIFDNSPDLRRLREEGYEVAITNGHLVITNVPYVTTQRSIAFGTLIDALNMTDVRTVALPANHVVHFDGSPPCNIDGSEIIALGRHGAPQKLAGALQITCSFSSKPESGGYSSYYEKFNRYADVLSAPARAIDSTVSAKTGRIVESTDEESPFVYLDTNSTRAKIGAISDKLKGQKIAIVGAGGTGSFVVDLVSKTPVKEIHIFDDDIFRLHNAYRAPGTPTAENLKAAEYKVRYLSAIYSRMHKGIIAHPERVTSDNINKLAGMSFVFLCMDAGPWKKTIVDWLLRNGIPFVDTGIGLQIGEDQLVGIIRTTTVTAGKSDHVERRIPMIDGDKDAYSANIQIAELNMINASFAVMRWKKFFGFYADYRKEFDTTYTIETNSLLSNET